MLFVPQSQTVGTRSEGRIEGKYARFYFGNGRAAHRTGVLRAEKLFFAGKIGYYQAAAYFKRRFETVGKARRYSVFYHQPVHHHAYVVFYLLVKAYVLVERTHFAVDFDAHIAGLAERFDFLFVFALSAARNRRFDENARTFSAGGDFVHYLVDRLFVY